MQQAVGLLLAQLQVGKEVEQQNCLVEGQADDIDLKGDGDDDFQGELAAPQDTGDLAIAVVRATKNAVGNQNGLPLFQTPDRPGVRQPTVARVNSVGIDVLEALRLGDLVGGADTAA